jgi:hypothetical protein
MTAGVFGSLPFPNQSGDQLISKAVSAAIAALFKRTGKLNRSVDADVQWPTHRSHGIVCASGGDRF